MNCHLISRVSRKAARIGTVAAALFALAVPFSAATGASAASASLSYTVSLSCATITKTEVIGGLLQSGWKWYQGGTGGAVLASGSLDDQCPLASGSSSATVSGTQPANADTLFAWMEGGSGGMRRLHGPDHHGHAGRPRGQRREHLAERHETMAQHVRELVEDDDLSIHDRSLCLRQFGQMVQR